MKRHDWGDCDVQLRDQQKPTKQLGTGLDRLHHGTIFTALIEQLQSACSCFGLKLGHYPGVPGKLGRHIPKTPEACMTCHET